ncbi:MAG: serine hydrolase [Cytophagaceae bacterium]|nr:serine hydrolase [Gemmatimonadaceae bacterium]
MTLPGFPVRVLQITRIVPFAALLALSATAIRAQPAIASLRDRPLAAWNQEEREFGFLRWSAINETRPVRRGARVHPLPAGAPLRAFARGGAEVGQLDAYIAEQKVAGMLVLQDGKRRLERYALGLTPAKRWTSFSVAKSITGTLVGAALRDGYIKSVDDLVTRYIPGLRGSAYDSVTVRQLLTMTSGVRWNEDYTDTTSDVYRFHYHTPPRGENATVSFMRTLARDTTPGTKWAYKTGETNLIGVLVSSATKQRLSSYLSRTIWGTYGMEVDATWQLDRGGHEHGGCCFQATLRDFGRFGQFILEQGRAGGRSRLADGWLDAATHRQAGIGAVGRGYGYQWWTVDDGTFAARGIHGQTIHVDPARRLVVVILSAWPVATGQDPSAARTEMMNRIIAAIDAEGVSRP